MSGARGLCWVLLVAGIAAGTIADWTPRCSPIFLGGYRVLAGDFHLHPLPYSASSLTPWDLMWDAQHQGLDVVGISGQNEAWSGRAARWVARHFGGPTVLPSEEIHGPNFHLIAAGIHSTISWRLSAADAIDEVHRQGGVAIAAHPTSSFWPAFDKAAMQRLDATEVFQPTAFDSATSASDLHDFFKRKPMAAIGSTDWHGLGPPGLCRTWIFVHANTEGDVLQAIRERRTVVFDGREYFGPEGLVTLAKSEPRLRQTTGRSRGAVLSRVLSVLGLLWLVRVMTRLDWRTAASVRHW